MRPLISIKNSDSLSIQCTHICGTNTNKVSP